MGPYAWMTDVKLEAKGDTALLDGFLQRKMGLKDSLSRTVLSADGAEIHVGVTSRYGEPALVLPSGSLPPLGTCMTFACAYAPGSNQAQWCVAVTDTAPYSKDRECM